MVDICGHWSGQTRESAEGYAVTRTGHQASPELGTKPDGVIKKHHLTAPGRVPWIPTGKLSSGER